MTISFGHQTDKTAGCGYQLHSTVGCESVDMVSEMSQNLIWTHN